MAEKALLALVTNVLCTNDAGETTAVPRSRLKFQPAVYGLLVEEGELLLLPYGEEGGWRLPGGNLSQDKTPEQTLQAHFHAIVGVTPQIEQLLLVDERYYLDGGGQGWRLVDMFFRLQRPSTKAGSALISEHEPRPQWVALADLQRGQLAMGDAAVNLLKQDVK